MVIRLLIVVIVYLLLFVLPQDVLHLVLVVLHLKRRCLLVAPPFLSAAFLQVVLLPNCLNWRVAGLVQQELNWRQESANRSISMFPY